MELLKSILYFSIFNHPLKKEEIFLFSNYPNHADFITDFQAAIAQNIIVEQNGYCTVPSQINFISKREIANVHAQEVLHIAYKKSNLIATYFPFVEAIGISGSLSKGYFDENSDIDYFIITKPNRLWFCRTLLVLYKKIFFS